MKLSPLAPKSFPDLPAIEGLRLASGCAAIKSPDRNDVMLALLDPGTVVAGVTTNSSTRSAAVRDCEMKLSMEPAADGAAILVNSGNSNAFTGQAGAQSVAAICRAVGQRLDLPVSRVFTCSTGVIGELLDDEKITALLPELASNLDLIGAEAAARAIMTTDTFPKGAVRQVLVGDRTLTIIGIAKGSGMIAPDMSTMLAYLFTDAVLDQDTAQAMLSRQNAESFNCISVDGDTSTSDTVLLAATGASGVQANQEFEAALGDLMRDLAQQIVRDGEGASKFITISVTGAAHDRDAKKVAMSIANSPLVKTAVAGEDPNWGRVVMAIGKSGADADRDRLTIRFGDIVIAENGWLSPSYREQVAANYMKQPEIMVSVDLAIADGCATVWTCDLTKDYIAINADYRS